MVEAAVLHRLLLLFIVIGLGLAAYAAAEASDAALQKSCTVNAFFSCQAVDQSGLTHVGPIPDWTIGMGGFILLLALDIPLIRSYEVRFLKGILLLSVMGVAATVYFTYVELVEIHALCPVCFSSYLANFGVLVAAVKLYTMRTEANLGEDDGKDEIPKGSPAP